VDGGPSVRPAPGLMPFSDAAQKKRKNATIAKIERTFNPWHIIGVCCVVMLWFTYYSRKEVLSKRVVRRHRDGLEGDLRDARARMGTLERDLFAKNKDYERVVREMDSLRTESETMKHELKEAKLELERTDAHVSTSKGCQKELESVKKDMELLRHKSRVTELELERAQHELKFNREHIKEEVIKEDIEELEKQIKEDEKAEGIVE